MVGGDGMMRVGRGARVSRRGEGVRVGCRRAGVSLPPYTYLSRDVSRMLERGGVFVKESI